MPMWLLLGAAGIASFGAWVVRRKLGLELSNTFRTFHGMKAVVTSVFDVVSSLDNLARMWSGQQQLASTPVRTQTTWRPEPVFTPPARYYPVHTPPTPAPRSGVEVGAALMRMNDQVIRPTFVSPNVVSIDDALPEDVPGILKYRLRDWTEEDARKWSTDYLVKEAHDTKFEWFLSSKQEEETSPLDDPGWEELCKETERLKQAHSDAVLLIRHFNEACRARGGNWLDLCIEDHHWELTEDDLEAVSLKS